MAATKKTVKKKTVRKKTVKKPRGADEVPNGKIKITEEGKKQIANVVKNLETKKPKRKRRKKTTRRKAQPISTQQQLLKLFASNSSLAWGRYSKAAKKALTTGTPEELATAKDMQGQAKAWEEAAKLYKETFRL